MTEDEWLSCTDPKGMLEFLQGKASARKLRLFVCACCLRMLQTHPHEPSSGVVEIAERYADGLATEEERRAALSIGRGYPGRYRGPPPLPTVRHIVAAAHASVYEDSVSHNAAIEARGYAEMLTIEDGRSGQDDSLRAAMVRDIFPYHPITFSPTWRTSTVLSLAQQMYESRDFSAMPILADALQDAECDSDDVLNHCRSDGVHVRGCWVVDALLGKE